MLVDYLNSVRASKKIASDADDGDTNAVRHFLWSAMMTYVFGERQAKVFLGTHEVFPGRKRCNKTILARDKSADQNNNWVGIQYAKSFGRRVVTYGALEDRARYLLRAGGLNLSGGEERC